MKYLSAYPAALRAQVEALRDEGKLFDWLRRKYPDAHGIRTDRALYDYVIDLKRGAMRNAEPLNLVAFDSKLHVIHHALGTHTTVSRVQGSKLKAKREIRIATLFRSGPEAFLRMIAVHELAHTKERDHGKAFYQLCTHLEPQYHQYEFDLRVYLTHLEAQGERPWG